MNIYPSKPNQYLETTQLANTTQNALNPTAPQTNPPNMFNSPNNIPQYTQNFNPQFNPSFNPQINPIISPNIGGATTNVTAQVNMPKVEVKTKRTFTRPYKWGLESKRVACPNCEQLIDTEIEKSMNMKAVCMAIGTLYVGFALIQMCKNKPISCEDCQHSCPKCGILIGAYYAM